MARKHDSISDVSARCPGSKSVLDQEQANEVGTLVFTRGKQCSVARVEVLACVGISRSGTGTDPQQAIVGKNNDFGSAVLRETDAQSQPLLFAGQDQMVKSAGHMVSRHAKS